MILFGDVCMCSDVFFVEYFLSLLIGPFVFSISRFYCQSVNPFVWINMQ
jgi:hypothetical protein